MNFNLAAYRHQLLALLFTAGVALLAYVVLVAPAFEARAEYRERLATVADQRAAYLRAAARAPALRREIEEIRARSRRGTGFFEPMAPALAAAELQQRVTSLIEDHGATLVSTQVITDTAADTPFPKVAIRVQMRAGVEPMAEIFYGVAGTVPVLLTDNVMIQSQNVGQAARARPPDTLLDVRFDVYGYMYRPATP